MTDDEKRERALDRATIEDLRRCFSTGRGVEESIRAHVGEQSANFYARARLRWEPLLTYVERLEAAAREVTSAWGTPRTEDRNNGYALADAVMALGALLDGTDQQEADRG